MPKGVFVVVFEGFFDFQKSTPKDPFFRCFQTPSKVIINNLRVILDSKDSKKCHFQKFFWLI
jgi:hypothetical protein